MLTISLTAEHIFTIAGLNVTNSLFTTWLGVVIAIFLVVFGMKKAKIVPRGFQLILENIYLFFLDLSEKVLEDKKMAERTAPFIATIFIFVLMGNIFTVVPGVGSIGFFEGEEKSRVNETTAGAFGTDTVFASEDAKIDGMFGSKGEDRAEPLLPVVAEHKERKFTPLFRPGSADLNTTLALALISVVITQIVGFKTLGIGYLKKFFNFKNPIAFFVGVLELISEFAKIISFSFRLFGNIFAGEVLLAVILMLVPYFAPIPFYGLELFVAVVQAFVFAMLTLVFIKLAMIPHTEEHH